MRRILVIAAFVVGGALAGAPPVFADPCMSCTTEEEGYPPPPPPPFDPCMPCTTE